MENLLIPLFIAPDWEELRCIAIAILAIIAVYYVIKGIFYLAFATIGLVAVGFRMAAQFLIVTVPSTIVELLCKMFVFMARCLWEGLKYIAPRLWSIIKQAFAHLRNRLISSDNARKPLFSTYK